MSRNVNDFRYRPLQSRLHEILDEHDLVTTALSDLDITTVLKGHPVPNYGPTLLRLRDRWQLLKRRLEHESNTGICREIGKGIAKMMRAEHVVRAVRAHVEFAPRDNVADLEALIEFVERFMETEEAEKNTYQDNRGIVAATGMRQSQADENSLYVNQSQLRRVVSLLYHGVKAAKAVGGSPSKNRSAVDSEDPPTPIVPASLSTAPRFNLPPSFTFPTSTITSVPATMGSHASKRSTAESMSPPPLAMRPRKRSRTSSSTSSPAIAPTIGALPFSSHPSPMSETHSPVLLHSPILPPVSSTPPVRYPRTPTKYKPQTHNRDGKRCLITSVRMKEQDLQIAHIIPYSVLNTDSCFEHNPFWKLLRSWLGEGRSAKVWSAVGREVGRGGGLLINLMCVTRDIHALWGRGEGVIIPELLGDEVVRGEEGNADMRFLMPVRWVRIDGTGGVESGTTTSDTATSTGATNSIPVTSDEKGESKTATDSESDSDSDSEFSPTIHSIPYHPPTHLHTVLKSSRSTNSVRKKTSQEYRPLKANEIIVLYNYMRDNENYPLPHPDLLRLWGAVSRLVRMSGMGELVDFERQEEEEQMEDRVCNGWTGWDDVESVSGIEYCAKRLSELVAWGWNETVFRESGEDYGSISDVAGTSSPKSVNGPPLIPKKPTQYYETNTGLSIAKTIKRSPEPQSDPVAMKSRPHAHDYQHSDPADTPSPLSSPVPYSSRTDTKQEILENTAKTRFIKARKTTGLARRLAPAKRKSTPGTLSGGAPRRKRVRYQ